ncbi:MAG TPA: prolyl oligopeptidase family serine peptidase [Solirubrobacterales bacterium]|nr:prolyl oligopeptidase family serine peptidase [Solirubrobacterales bacterium]
MNARSRSATTGRRSGFGGIGSSQPTHRAGAMLALLAALLLALLAAPAALAAAPEKPAKPAKSKWDQYPPPELGVAHQAGPKPHLILLHGGSFLYDDDEFEATTREAALKAGFIPHYTTYPLGDMPAAVLAVRAEARRLRQKLGGTTMVYAYGSSAGGTLAALLSGDGLVGAAVAKAPVSNLVSWEWPLEQYGPKYYERVALNLPARYRLSPVRRAEKNPLLLIHGIDDQVVPISQSEQFANKFQRVFLWEVLGGHHAERSQPEVLQSALIWLAEIAEGQAQGTIPG